MSRLTLDLGGESANSGVTVAPRTKTKWDGKRCPIAAALARDFGLSPLTLERHLRVWNHAVAKVVRKMRELGADKRADAYLEPIRRADEGREPPPDCPATWDLADVADAREDIAQHRYEREPSVKNRAAYIAALREERRHVTALLDLMVDEQERATREQERHS